MDIFDRVVEKGSLPCRVRHLPTSKGQPVAVENLVVCRRRFSVASKCGAIIMGTEAVDVLHTFDFGSIEEMDPSIGEVIA